MLVSGCGQQAEAPLATTTLRVGIRAAPGYFQSDEKGGSGFEHDLVIGFSDSLQLKPRFHLAQSNAELMEWLAEGRIDMAARIPVEESGSKQWSMIPFRAETQVIVGRAGDLGPARLEELSGHRVRVIAGSATAATLSGLSAPPEIVAITDTDELTLLEQTATERSGLAAVLEAHLDMAGNFYPELRPVLRLPEKATFGWAFAPDAAPHLKTAATAYLNTVLANGTLARTHDRYFGHIKRIGNTEAADFIRRMGSLLPALRHHFHAAQELTGLDWRLIAALAYQESKWDPLATSYTNVRGMMMLTEETADHLGVKNRLDTAESVRAGARYLLELVEMVPGSTPNPDRTWLGLAAYNLGMGHLRAGLAIARGLKRDTDSWYEMKQVLPLLARPEYYSRLKSGPARGGEAVIMVENIRTYYDILSRYEAPYYTPFPKPLLTQPAARRSTPPR